MDETTIAEAVQRIYMRNYSSLAATGVLLADYLATYESEFAYIWKKPITPVKVTFFLSRYWAIIGQAINCYVLLRILSPDRVPIDRKACESLMNYQIFLALSLHLLSDSILVRRVAVLYNYHRLVRYGLLIFLVVQMLCSVIVIQVGQPNNVWNSTCDIEISSFSLSGPAISTVLVLSHCLIWLITTSKRRITFAIILPFTSLSLRDGAWAALFYISIFLSVTPHAVVANSFRTEMQLTWPATLISIMTCRLILNTREELLDDDVAASNDTPLSSLCDSYQSLDITIHESDSQ